MLVTNSTNFFHSTNQIPHLSSHLEIRGGQREHRITDREAIAPRVQHHTHGLSRAPLPGLPPLGFCHVGVPPSSFPTIGVTQPGEVMGSS